MRNNAYQKIMEDDQSAARDRERQLFMEAVRAMEACDADPADMMSRVRAIAAVNRLWSALLCDLAAPENQLPVDLRAKLVSIGIFVLRRLETLRSGGTGSFDGLIEIHRAIGEGLRQ